MEMRTLLTLLALALVPVIQGCVLVAAGAGVASGYAVGEDRRSMRDIADDQLMERRAAARISEKHPETHINVSVFARGLLKQLVTRIYFADHGEANEVDPVLSRIDDPAVRKTIVAEKTNGAGIPTYRFDVVLQGKGETAFFEL